MLELNRYTQMLAQGKIMFYFASVKFIKKNACPMSLYGFIININKGFYRNISLF